MDGFDSLEPSSYWATPMTEPTERSPHRARSLPAAYLPGGHSSTHVATSLKVFSVQPRTRLGGLDSWNVFTGLYGSTWVIDIYIYMYKP